VTTPFAERFAEAESTTIEVDGEELHSLVHVSIEGPIFLVVVRARSRADRPQGLVVDGGGAELGVEGTVSPRLTLWSDTAPETVVIEIAEEGTVNLRMWNTWRDDSVEHAWVGWAAMKRHDREGVTTLSCRDGHPDGDFDDLVIELSYGASHDSGLFTTALQ
jgi:hypothetical protein